jgi:SAM-dependent methyltransferase
VARKYGRLVAGRVLDVGCDTRRLKALCPGIDYVGIDVGGEPDVRIDLERAERLPFDDASFDCVVCTDVLEHLDALHRVFGELVRVARGRIIVSLPNCWNNLRSRLARGGGEIRYYGLPADPPDDRHKWFFNVDDVVAFMRAQEHRHPVRVAGCCANVRPGLANRARRLLYPGQRRYLNRYAHSVWTILERNAPPASA